MVWFEKLTFGRFVLTKWAIESAKYIKYAAYYPSIYLTHFISLYLNLTILIFTLSLCTAAISPLIAIKFEIEFKFKFPWFSATPSARWEPKCFIIIMTSNRNSNILVSCLLSWIQFYFPILFLLACHLRFIYGSNLWEKESGKWK